MAAKFLQQDWTRSDCMHLHTDASSLTSFGAFSNESWLQGRWPRWMKDVNPCIEFHEMSASLFLLQSENFSVTHNFSFWRFHLDACNAGKNSKFFNEAVLYLMRRMVMVAAAAKNFVFTMDHIPVHDNCIADSHAHKISRRPRHIRQVLSQMWPWTERLTH